jgi:hypothetical protein
MSMKFQGFTVAHKLNGKMIPEMPVGPLYDTLDEAIADATSPDNVGRTQILSYTPAFATGKMTFTNSKFYPEGFELGFFIRLCHA